MRIINVIALSAVLFFGILCIGGCSWIIGQGETAAEGNRRHLRQLDIERQQLADDVDAVLLTDRPSRLSDLRVR